MLNIYICMLYNCVILCIYIYYKYIHTQHMYIFLVAPPPRKCPVPPHFVLVLFGTWGVESGITPRRRRKLCHNVTRRMLVLVLVVVLVVVMVVVLVVVTMFFPYLFPTLSLIGLMGPVYFGMYIYTDSRRFSCTVRPTLSLPNSKPPSWIKNQVIQSDLLIP